jgi:hypothetical protein
MALPVETSPSAASDDPAPVSQVKPTTLEARDDRMPAGIAFIVGNEFAERFCYYGINAILTIYMTQNLGFGQASATKWHSLFKASAYFFPLIGATISDVFWGKYRTIMTFSCVYAAGCAIAALVPGTYGLFGGLFLVALAPAGSSRASRPTSAINSRPRTSTSSSARSATSTSRSTPARRSPSGSAPCCSRSTGARPRSACRRR